MTSYKDSGVDVEAGDAASKSAYKAASSTFPSRKGMIGEPVFEEGGFGGLLDMGNYYLVMSDDSTGTKIDIAHQMQKFDTLGYDLLAMVADDIVCTGAEVISLSNCLDVPVVDPLMIETLLHGLAQACSEQHIVVPAGEIAEVPGAVNRGVWSATAIGIVQKERVIRPETIEEGDVVLALQSGVFRSNGLSLVRKILTDAHGESWHTKEWRDGISWGDIVLTPSIIYHNAILSLLGRYEEGRPVHLKGIAHITGGGIPSKFQRILKHSGLGADLSDLFPPHDAVLDVLHTGHVATEEAYHTWNMGNGMLLVVSPKDVETTLSLLSKHHRTAKVVGTITSASGIRISAFDGTIVQ